MADNVIQFVPKQEAQEKKPVAHIYTFAAVWLFLIHIVADGYFERDVVNILVVALFSFVPAVIVKFISNLISKGKQPKQEKPQKVKTTVPKAAELKKLPAELAKGYETLKEMEEARNKIQENSIRTIATELIKIAHSVLEKLKSDESLIPTMNRFLTFYLSNVVELLNKYYLMENQTVKGDNVLSAKEKIEKTLNMLQEPFKKQLDALFSASVMNLSAEVDVLENLLKSDGLLDSDTQMSSINKGDE